jgi:hypothetical protein
MGFFKKLGKDIKKGLGKGLGIVNKAGKGIVKTIGKTTGKLDRATGGLLSDVVEQLPGGKQLMQGYDLTKKGLKTSENLQGALEGKKSFKSVLRDTELIPSKYKDEVLMGYQEGANEFGRQKNINRGKIRDMAIDVGRTNLDRFKNAEGSTKDRLNMIRPAVRNDIVQQMAGLKIRNPILANRLASLR